MTSLLCDIETWPRADQPCRIQIEEDDGLTTISDERISSTAPDAKILEVLGAIDFDIEQVRWFRDRLAEILSGSAGRFEWTLPSTDLYAPPSRLRVADELVSQGWILVVDEMVSSRAPTAIQIVTMGEIVLLRAEATWVLAELDDILGRQGGVAP